jgi:serine/threonine-protein kinase
MQSPTLTAAQGTQLGVILGTAAYMAPEQAKGMAVDKRADIWAFGVVLYEMLVGRSLFAGDTVTDTLAGVLKTEIDFSKLPTSTPPAIRRLLRRCLERNSKNRLHDIADARIVLDELISGRTDEGARGPALAAPLPAALRGRLAGAAAAIALAGAALGYFAAAGRSPAPSAAAERRFVLPAAGRSPSDRQAIARDGRRVAYTAGGQLWLRSLSETEPRAIAGGEGASDPFWSPDGREVGFLRGGAVWRLGVEGGHAKRICELPTGVVEGATWSDQGSVIFAVATGGWTGNLYQCPAAGGNATVLLEPDEIGKRLRRPHALPAGAGVLYVSDFRSERTEIRLLRDGVSRLLFEDQTHVDDAVAAGRRLVYASLQAGERDLWRVDLDSEGSPAGEPILVASGATAPTAADDGALLYAAFEEAPRRVALVTRDGVATPLGEPFRSEVSNDNVQIAPGGQRATIVLSDLRSNQADEEQLWIVDLASGARQRLPLGDHSRRAAWSPDGRELLVTDSRTSLRIVPLVGGEPRSLPLALAAFQPRYTADGRWIVYYAVTPESGRDLFRLAVDGSSPPEPLVREPGQQANPDVSPDGRFLAYQSDESGRPEIYVRPYPTGERKWQVSTGGGVSPIWNRQGGELVWLADNAIWSAPVSTAGEGFEAGAPRLLLRGDAIGADLESGSIFYSRQARRRDQGPAGSLHGGQGTPGEIRARSAAARSAPSPQHRFDLRHGGERRHPRARHGARRRPDPGRAARARAFTLQ